MKYKMKTGQKSSHVWRLIAVIVRALIDRRLIARATYDRLTRAICLESRRLGPYPRNVTAGFRRGSWRKNSLIGISVDISQDTHGRRLPGTRHGSGFLWGFLHAVPEPRWRHPKRFDFGRTNGTAALPINYGIFIGLRFPLWSKSLASATSGPRCDSGCDLRYRCIFPNLISANKANSGNPGTRKFRW